MIIRSSRSHRCILTLLLSLLVSACSGLGGEPRIVATLPPRPTAVPVEHVEQFIASPDLERGAAVFSANCTACHGVSGRGDGASVVSGAIPYVPDFTDPAALTVETPEEYFAVITEGRLEKMMPPWGAVLPEADRWAVAMYVRSLRDAPRPQPLADAGFSPIAEIPGTITGVVTNASAGGVVPPGTTVALHVLDGEFNETYFEIAPVENGVYRFENVPLRADRAYLVTALTGAAVFSSDVIGGDTGASSLDLPVTIYDTTTDPAAIAFDLLVLQIARDGLNLRVTQVINLVNSGDKAFVGADPTASETVRLPIPAGAEILNVDELAGRYALADDGTALLGGEPVLPGADTLVRVVYRLPYDGGASFDLPLAYPLLSPAELMIAPRLFSVTGDQFTAHGTQHFSTGVYESYLGSPLPAGETLRVTLADAPAQVDQAAAPLSDGRLAVALGIGLLGGAFLAFAAIGVLRSRGSAAKGGAPAEDG